MWRWTVGILVGAVVLLVGLFLAAVLIPRHAGGLNKPSPVLVATAALPVRVSDDCLKPLPENSGERRRYPEGSVCLQRSGNGACRVFRWSKRVDGSMVWIRRPELDTGFCP